jgi:branched-chain amino acid transport system substrate-binding protein
MLTTNPARATMTGIAALLCTSIVAPAGAAEPYRIGVVAPTAGPVATVGLRQLRTLQWWEREVNKKGGINGRSVQLVHCNDEGRPEKAVACVRDLLGQKVVLLINSSVTGPIRATVPLVKDGPVMLTPSPYIEPDAAGYVFQTTPTDRDMTEALARYLTEGKVKKIGMVAATDASGEGSTANARSVFPKAGVDVDIERIDLKATDATVQLAKVARPDVAAVYSAYSGGGAAVVVKGFSSLGFEQPLIVSNANVSDAFISLIKSVMPKRLLSIAIRGVDPDLLATDAERERLKNFQASYKELNNEQPDHLNLLALGLADTAAAILSSVKDPGDPAAVKKFLQGTTIQSFQPIRFKEGRNIGMTPDDAAVLEFKDGVWKKAAPL